MGKVCVYILAARGWGAFRHLIVHSFLIPQKLSRMYLGEAGLPHSVSTRCKRGRLPRSASACSSSAWLRSLVKRGTHDLSQLNVGQSLGFFFPFLKRLGKRFCFSPGIVKLLENRLRRLSEDLLGEAKLGRQKPSLWRKANPTEEKSTSR